MSFAKLFQIYFKAAVNTDMIHIIQVFK